MTIGSTITTSNQFFDHKIQVKKNPMNSVEQFEDDDDISLASLEPKLSSLLKPSSFSPYNSPSLTVKKAVKFDDSLSTLGSSISSLRLSPVPPSPSPKSSLRKRVGTLPSSSPSPSLLKKKNLVSSSSTSASPSISMDKRHVVWVPPPPSSSPSSPSLQKSLAALPSSAPSASLNKRVHLRTSLSAPSLKSTTTTTSTSLNKRANLLTSLSVSSLKSTISVSSTSSRFQNVPSSSLRAPIKSSFRSTFSKVPAEKRNRVLSFAAVHIREYSIRLGQCSVPTCNGAPLGIGWNWSREGTIPVDIYEEERAPQRQRRPTEDQLCLSTHWRTIILKDQGVSVQDIEAATAECDKIRARREASMKATKAGQVCADLFSNLKGFRSSTK